MSYERTPYANVNRNQSRCGQINTHELMKREIYKQGYDSDTNFRITNPPILGNSIIDENAPPPEVGFEDVYLMFDSTQRTGTSDYSSGEISWSIPVLNNSVDVKNCVAIRLLPFYFPNIYTATTAPDYFYYLRAFIEIQNLPSTQSILGPKNNKFHFVCDVQNTSGQSVLLVPLNDTFYFKQPLTSLSDFQVRFLVPPTTSLPSNFKRIPIPKDTLTVQSLTTGGFGYNPIRFQVTGGDTTSALGLIGSMGVPGLAVVITDYASNDSAINQAVNNPLGVFVTTVLSSTTFEIAGINATTVTGPYTATMFIMKNRIELDVRFTSVKNQVTNHMDINHD